MLLPSLPGLRLRREEWSFWTNGSCADRHPVDQVVPNLGAGTPFGVAGFAYRVVQEFGDLYKLLDI
jgi:hypothetical protein